MYRSLNLLRILLGIIFLSHAMIRIQAGTVGGFGDFLVSNHFPFATILAWGITLFELARCACPDIGF